ncbi:hypothetical protein CLH62_19015 [Marinobacter guineae]|uniref:MSHA biogenesis protein MshP n=1 Tax=Marinobacter guineae TaxID=432303 RepID=A0A2G1VBB9_9GAMM|nr:hypothetical protein [Marinobacter guineae]PHQ23829.1 hypothetical protein CLH62_19015 [Marinobacter guineae]
MPPKRPLYKQTGAGLPIALFIITVLALLVIGMAQLQESSGKAVSLQIQSQRAFFAAESGAQVGVHRILSQLNNGAAVSCPADITSFGASLGLTSCSVEYACDTVSGGAHTLVSVGRCGTGADRAERTIEVRVQ